jgi:hypothetical protein
MRGEERILGKALPVYTFNHSYINAPGRQPYQIFPLGKAVENR